MFNSRTRKSVGWKLQRRSVACPLLTKSGELVLEVKSGELSVWGGLEGSEECVLIKNIWIQFIFSSCSSTNVIVSVLVARLARNQLVSTISVWNPCQNRVIKSNMQLEQSFIKVYQRSFEFTTILAEKVDIDAELY